MATIQEVFQGTTLLSTGNELATVILSEAVDLSRSFLVFSTRTDGNNNNTGNALIAGRITNTTTLNFIRSGSVRNVWITWQVCEFDSSVTVYRGITTLSSVGATNVTIPSVDLTKSFVIFSAAMNYDTSDIGAEENIRATLTSSTNLELYIYGTADNTVYWQVIEYQHCTVQQITFNPSTSSNQVDQTISVAVDLTRTLVFGSYYTSVSRMNNNQQFVYYMLNSTTIRFIKSGTYFGTTSWTVFVIEFEENEVRTTNLNAAIGSSDLTINVTLSESFSNYSIVKMNSNSYNSLALINDANDNFQYSLFTQTFISNTSLQLQRVTANIAGNAYFQVIEFIPREKRLISRGLNRGFMRKHIMT